MSKRPPPGTCIHCGNHFEKMEWDHIFHKAWYPDTTPPGLEKWKAPSCPICNRAYGELENDLLVRFGLSLDPRDPDSKVIIEKAMRAVDPSLATNEKDRAAREKKRAGLIDEMKKISAMGPLNRKHFIPGFSPMEHTARYGEYPTVGIGLSHGSLIKFGEKLIKGSTYIDEGSFIPNGYDLKVLFLLPEHQEHFLSTIVHSGLSRHRGPGLIIGRAKSIEDRFSAVFIFVLWRRIVLNGICMPRDKMPNLERFKAQG
jgi:hypothetical protein